MEHKHSTQIDNANNNRLCCLGPYFRIRKKTEKLHLLSYDL